MITALFRTATAMLFGTIALTLLGACHMLPMESGQADFDPASYETFTISQVRLDGQTFYVAGPVMRTQSRRVVADTLREKGYREVGEDGALEVSVVWLSRETQDLSDPRYDVALGANTPATVHLLSPRVYVRDSQTAELLWRSADYTGLEERSLSEERVRSVLKRLLKPLPPRQ